MFVNGLALFVRLLWLIHFTTLDYISKCTKARLIRSLNKFISIYNSSGFNIRTALMDQEFYFLIPDFPVLNINTTANIKHVPGIEGQI